MRDEGWRDEEMKEQLISFNPSFIINWQSTFVYSRNILNSRGLNGLKIMMFIQLRQSSKIWLHDNCPSLAALISSACTASTENEKNIIYLFIYQHQICIGGSVLTCRRSCLSSLSGRDATRFIALTISFSNLSPNLSAAVHNSVLLKTDLGQIFYRVLSTFHSWRTWSCQLEEK